MSTSHCPAHPTCRSNNNVHQSDNGQGQELCRHRILESIMSGHAFSSSKKGKVHKGLNFHLKLCTWFLLLKYCLMMLLKVTTINLILLCYGCFIGFFSTLFLNLLTPKYFFPRKPKEGEDIFSSFSIKYIIFKSSASKVWMRKYHIFIDEQYEWDSFSFHTFANNFIYFIAL